LWARGLHGKPLLHHVVDVVSRVAGRVVVITRGFEPRGKMPPGVETLFDEPFAYRGCTGPFAAFLTALLTGGSRFLFVSGDYGYIGVDVLRALVHVGGGSVASIVWCNGVVETLLTLAPREALEAARRACRDWGLKPRPSLVHRLARSLVLVGVDALAVDPSSLVSVNKPLDLVSPRPRGIIGCGRVALAVEPPLAMLGGQPTPSELLEEARYWLERGVYLLALHAARDAKNLGARSAEEVERVALERMGLKSLHD